MNQEQFQLLARYQYSSEAIIYKAKLESEGIEVYIRDNNLIDADPIYSNAVGGIKLFVNSSDFEKAQQVLNQISEFSLDEFNKPLKCPNCNNEQVEFTTTIKDLKSFITFLFSFLFIIFPFYTKYKYKCSECKFEFD